jgi:hypothetical protein
MIVALAWFSPSSSTSWPAAAQAEHHLVDGRDSRRIPQVRVREVELDVLDALLEVEGLEELIGRDKEELAPDRVDRGSAWPRRSCC